MPTYEYKCKDCDSTFALQQPIWAKRKGAKCTGCGSENTERLISRFNAGRSDDSCGPGSSSGPFC
jgi:putative FmdB family regulatory protein